MRARPLSKFECVLFMASISAIDEAARVLANWKRAAASPPKGLSIVTEQYRRSLDS
jgi:hypothetical protein